jgi:hypothetical protein
MADEIQCVSCGVRFPPQNEHQGKMVVCPHCHRPTRNEPAGPSPAANPYASPEAAAASPLVADTHQGSPVDSPEIYRALAGTRPWALFLGILGFIVGGIGVVWALLVFGGVLFLRSLSMMQAVFFAAAALVVFLVALGSWFPFRYGRRIGVFLSTRDLHDLERALSSQRAFWQMAGIAVVVVTVALIALALIAG